VTAYRFVTSKCQVLFKYFLLSLFPAIDLKRADRDKAYLKAYSPVLAEREKKEPDWKYYCYNCLKKPFDRLFCVLKGYEYRKGKKEQPTDHLWEPYLTQICANDVDQSARLAYHPLPLIREKRPLLPTLPNIEDGDEEPRMPSPPKEAKAPKEKPMKNGDIRGMFGGFSKNNNNNNNE
jgi:hypothetical protein